MRQFAWLHLTDWHFGIQGHSHLWPNIREQFFHDLKLLHKKCGPWNAVFFTGDLTQRADPGEFEGVERLLSDLWQRLKLLGSNPVLLAVPGNHDLSRPGPSPESLVLTRWSSFPEIHEDFWRNSNSSYRSVVDKAFAAYKNWWSCTRGRGRMNAHPGILPGDFSATVDTGALKIGVLGLNTAFLQLAEGDYRGKLALDARQFHDACGGDAPEWINSHHCCLLLTHHGPDWLDEPSRNRHYPEINPAGRFAVHLFGHMHENALRDNAVGGGPTLRMWQGHSLFGLEHYGDQHEEDRRHGYSAGRIDFVQEGGFIRHWPRIARRHGANGWIIVPDYETCILEEDQGTRPYPVEVPLKVEPCQEARCQPAPKPERPQPEMRAIAPDSAALQIWREKLEFFLKELAAASDAGQKFNLRKLIEEARRTIRELGG